MSFKDLLRQAAEEATTKQDTSIQLPDNDKIREIDSLIANRCTYVAEKITEKMLLAIQDYVRRYGGNKVSDYFYLFGDLRENAISVSSWTYNDKYEFEIGVEYPMISLESAYLSQQYPDDPIIRRKHDEEKNTEFLAIRMFTKETKEKIFERFHYVDRLIPTDDGQQIINQVINLLKQEGVDASFVVEDKKGYSPIGKFASTSNVRLHIETEF